jgi:5-methylcytosine-specific restriction endonuclease McrA
VKKADPFYLSKEWEAVRKQVIKRDKWKCNTCGVKCLGKAKNKPSPHVDHIIELKLAPSKALDPQNLQLLCSSCHSRKTIMTTHSKGKPEIGPDGYPLEAPDRPVSNDMNVRAMVAMRAVMGVEGGQ